MKVVFNHDAAIDEYMAGLLLTTMSQVELENIIITNGDCIDGPAMSAAYRIQQYIGDPDLPLYLAQSRGWNQFPWDYRKDSISINNIDCLKSIPSNTNWPYYPFTSDVPKLTYQELSALEEKQPLSSFPTNGSSPSYPDGNAALTATLSNAVQNGDKLTLLICCPLTLLREVLEPDPGLAAAIEQLIWMGGAVDGISGNLDPNTLPAEVANPFAEWNVYWDPYAVAWIFDNTDFPITLFPLNVTNEAKVSQYFLDGLKSQSASSKLSTLAYQSYQLVLDQPFYCMWDVTAASYLDQPGLFNPAISQQLAIITDGYYQGTLIPHTNGRQVEVITAFADLQGFYDYVLKQFNTY